MPRFLLFRLHGPLAAWGDIAVGEVRPSTPHPSRSAVLGLMAAALGIRRHEEERQAALADACAFTVRVDALGVPLRDYQTIQQADSVARLKHLRSRRDELADRHNLYTTLSSRDYRCDGLYTCCLQWRDGQTFSADEVAAALRRPRLSLYLGRKSCPPALPLAPQVIEAEWFEQAMAQYDAQRTEAEQGFLAALPTSPYPRGRKVRATAHPVTREGAGRQDLYWEDAVATALRPLHSTPRHDRPVHRARRQFGPRTEHYAPSGA
ncbi:MAG: type I-E CRISPR-associated protein Cas5/CasD [Chromatiaceae bacterium]|nr:type I-E CRISPR-associated protein Cas5/CasD [Chromatiaceae bacterium]MBP6733278.1 type I-E CRISPR-associated protein Cas5/CasD [Chromatiaceae bacterium]MBP6806782.1 type I-E CRISPR-associated protein Cas5/CasD [Chromatiaceae bacterium]MBP8282810.1 type I-E CRISPR-associated protein Cas5/CasD [Chromatiaceae bacterium]MBP8288548.1 type I-E CRISPR-associated protein Cas5/CasD [Chromatiaceae bacterium]